MPARNTPDLSAFARDVAQELTPSLMALWNRIEVMLAEARSDGLPADSLDDLEMLRHHAVRMVAIVKGLLCVSGEPVFGVGPVDLNTIVEDSLSPIVPRLARRQVEIEPLLDPTIPPVLADAEALRYALTSLVETAAETMTTVHVTTQRVGEDGARIHVGTSRLTQAERNIIPQQDGLRVLLADAIVRSLGGTVQRRGGNPAVTYAISLRLAS
jgi:signal transduction histidine kinase